MEGLRRHSECCMHEPLHFGLPVMRQGQPAPFRVSRFAMHAKIAPRLPPDPLSSQGTLPGSSQASAASWRDPLDLACLPLGHPWLPAKHAELLKRSGVEPVTQHAFNFQDAALVPSMWQMATLP